VGIVAAFLRRQGRRDALTSMWAGVALAVVLCLAVGAVLTAVDRELPHRAQEGLETVVALVAVAMVTYMIVWMRTHARGLRAQLQADAAGALARGSAWALVAMAFLAVLREGFDRGLPFGRLPGGDRSRARGAGRLPPDSHVRLAAPRENGGTRLLRRGYSYTDGLDAELGQLDAGLFFLAYVRDPAAFVALQRRLGAADKLNEYIKHVGSGHWAIPPGARRGGWVGAALLGENAS
jgi:hypothetical protein